MQGEEGKSVSDKAVYDVDIYFHEALSWVMDGHWAQHPSLKASHAIRISPVNGHVELFNVPEGRMIKLDWIPTPSQMTARDWRIIRGE